MPSPELNPTEGIFAERRAMRKRIIIPFADGDYVLKQYIPDDAVKAFRLIYDNNDYLLRHGERINEEYKKLEDFRRSITYPTVKTETGGKLQRVLSDKVRFGIWNNEGELLGHIGITPDSSNPYTGQIGYYLAEPFAGQGITSQAVSALSDYAFSSLGYTSLFAFVREDNIKSVRVLQKAAYKRFSTQKYSFKDREGRYILYEKLKGQSGPRFLL